METKQFFTTEFYKDPQLTLDVMNKLVGSKQVADKEMYQDGTFLYMEVFENDTTKEILSPVISDLEAYKAFNNEGFVSDETTEIGLCALQDEHSRFFRDFEGDKEIRWNHEAEAFVFAEDMPQKID